MEKEIWKSLKYLLTNNCDEYTSKEFKNYYSSHKIRYERTVFDTLQYNGVAERINLAIIEEDSYMLRMTKSFLGEVTCTTCYIKTDVDYCVCFMLFLIDNFIIFLLYVRYHLILPEISFADLFNGEINSSKKKEKIKFD